MPTTLRNLGLGLGSGGGSLLLPETREYIQRVQDVPNATVVDVKSVNSDIKKLKELGVWNDVSFFWHYKAGRLLDTGRFSRIFDVKTRAVTPALYDYAQGTAGLQPTMRSDGSMLCDDANKYLLGESLAKNAFRNLTEMTVIIVATPLGVPSNNAPYIIATNTSGPTRLSLAVNDARKNRFGGRIDDSTGTLIFAVYGTERALAKQVICGTFEIGDVAYINHNNSANAVNTAFHATGQIPDTEPTLVSIGALPSNTTINANIYAILVLPKVYSASIRDGIVAYFMEKEGIA